MGAFEYLSKNHLTASFFETGAMAALTKLRNPIFLGQGVQLVPNDNSLAGFVTGAFCLATMATLHF